MAENFLKTGEDYWSQYGNTTLHTNYNYFRRNIYFTKNIKSVMPTSILKLKNDVDKLTAKEQLLYNQFGTSNYEDFMKIIRKLMSGPDGKVISRFTNESLLKTVIHDIVQDVENHADVGKATLTLYIDSEDAEKKLREINKTLDSIFDAAEKGSKLSSKASMNKGSDGRVGLSFEANPQIMKVIINRLKSTQFHPSKLNTDILSKFIKDNELGEITFEKNGRKISNKQLSSEIKYRPFPWGYSNAEIREAWENPKTKQIVFQELKEAVLAIRNYILNNIGIDASPELKKALKETLDDVLPYPFNPSLHYNIFFVGANYRNGLLGAFGEFGTALLLNYLKTLGGASITTERAKVVGQSLGKQDVTFGGLGFQVKNYSIAESETEAYTRAKLEVRQHPAELAEYFDDKQSFVAFVVNYYFNENIQKSINGNSRQQMEDINEYLQKHYLGELMRLAINDVEQPVRDTVVFYSIGGKYLIPGSELLKFYLQQQDYTQIEMNYPSPTIQSGEVHRWEDEYWKKTSQNNGASVWEPKRKNLKTFEKMASNDISFIITMKKDFNLKQYAINNGETIK